MPAPKTNGKNCYYWENLTGREIDAIDRSRAVVCVSCSPLEVHGPHLPTKTDYFEAEGLTTRVIEKLGETHPEIVFLRLPPIYVSTDVVPQAGSLMFRTQTITAVLSDLGRTLCRQGFANIWVASFHGGPRHFLAIEKAANQVNRRYGGRMISLFSLLATRLTKGTSDATGALAHIEGLSPEILRGDTHGGALETSLMLHLGGGVDAGYQELERRTVDGKRREKGLRPIGQDANKTSFVERILALTASQKFFEQETYAGHPAAGSADIGGRALDYLADQTAEAMGQVWRGELRPEDCHSPLWPFRWILMSPIVQVIYERIIGYKNAIF